MLHMNLNLSLYVRLSWSKSALNLNLSNRESDRIPELSRYSSYKINILNATAYCEEERRSNLSYSTKTSKKQFLS